MTSRTQRSQYRPGYCLTKPLRTGMVLMAPLLLVGACGTTDVADNSPNTDAENTNPTATSASDLPEPPRSLALGVPAGGQWAQVPEWMTSEVGSGSFDDADQLAQHLVDAFNAAQDPDQEGLTTASVTAVFGTREGLIVMLAFLGAADDSSAGSIETLLVKEENGAWSILDYELRGLCWRGVSESGYCT